MCASATAAQQAEETCMKNTGFSALELSMLGTDGFQFMGWAGRLIKNYAREGKSPNQAAERILQAAMAVTWTHIGKEAADRFVSGFVNSGDMTFDEVKAFVTGIVIGARLGKLQAADTILGGGAPMVTGEEMPEVLDSQIAREFSEPIGFMSSANYDSPFQAEGGLVGLILASEGR